MLEVNAFKEAAGHIFEKIVALRREIHAYPELAFEEQRTAALIARELRLLGIPFEQGVAKTGVVALIEGKKPGKTIALRADMDALPIQEKNEVTYASTVADKMHACGHDVHTASLLGAAGILQQFRAQLSGSIKLIFQPSEEKLPGGAKAMIEEGVLNKPEVDGILGQHVMPYIEVGKIGMRSGKYMASTDEIYIEVRGKGGHAAHPYTFIDPVYIGAEIITALQSVVSRSADPRIPSVLSFGKASADGATNIIPDAFFLAGTFRTFDESWRSRAHEKIRSVTEGVARALGGEAFLEIRKGYPALTNDPDLTGRAWNAAANYVGEENIVELDLWPAAEDFSWYTQEIPGCFYRLGTRNEAKGIIHGLHTPRFNIDEEALRLSTGLMAWLAYNELLNP